MDPATAMAMVQAMIDAGQAPPQVIEAVRKGGKIKIDQKGQVVIEPPPGMKFDPPADALPKAKIDSPPAGGLKP